MSNSSENFMKPVAKNLLGISNDTFYFFAKIKRHNFSQREKNSKKISFNQNTSNISGHLISIESAFTLYNLLPIEM